MFNLRLYLRTSVILCVAGNVRAIAWRDGIEKPPPIILVGEIFKYEIPSRAMVINGNSSVVFVDVELIGRDGWLVRKGFNETEILTGTPTNDDRGEFIILITAMNGHKATANITFTVNVRMPYIDWGGRTDDSLATSSTLDSHLNGKEGMDVFTIVESQHRHHVIEGFELHEVIDITAYNVNTYEQINKTRIPPNSRGDVGTRIYLPNNVTLDIINVSPMDLEAKHFLVHKHLQPALFYIICPIVLIMCSSVYIYSRSAQVRHFEGSLPKVMKRITRIQEVPFLSFSQAMLRKGWIKLRSLTTRNNRVMDAVTLNFSGERFDKRMFDRHELADILASTFFPNVRMYVFKQTDIPYDQVIQGISTWAESARQGEPIPPRDNYTLAQHTESCTIERFSRVPYWLRSWLRLRTQSYSCSVVRCYIPYTYTSETILQHNWEPMYQRGAEGRDYGRGIYMTLKMEEAFRRGAVFHDNDGTPWSAALVCCAFTRNGFAAPSNTATNQSSIPEDCDAVLSPSIIFVKSSQQIYVVGYLKRALPRQETEDV